MAKIVIISNKNTNKCHKAVVTISDTYFIVSSINLHDASSRNLGFNSYDMPFQCISVPNPPSSSTAFGSAAAPRRPTWAWSSWRASTASTRTGSSTGTHPSHSQARSEWGSFFATWVRFHELSHILSNSWVRGHFSWLTLVVCDLATRLATHVLEVGLP